MGYKNNDQYFRHRKIELENRNQLINEYNNILQQIDTLEVAVQETKKSGAAQTSELKKLIEDNTANTAALEMQAAQLGEVNGQIDGLNVKFDGAAAQINAETVAIHAKIESVETTNAAAINEIKSIGKMPKFSRSKRC